MILLKQKKGDVALFTHSGSQKELRPLLFSLEAERHCRVGCVYSRTLFMGKVREYTHPTFTPFGDLLVPCGPDAYGNSSSAEVGSARNARMSAVRDRSSVSICRVGPLPTCNHTTFGGGPSALASFWKSASLRYDGESVNRRVCPHRPIGRRREPGNDHVL